MVEFAHALGSLSAGMTATKLGVAKRILPWPMNATARRSKSYPVRQRNSRLKPLRLTTRPCLSVTAYRR
jgi:hypothetical protein